MDLPSKISVKLDEYDSKTCARNKKIIIIKTIK